MKIYLIIVALNYALSILLQITRISANSTDRPPSVMAADLVLSTAMLMATFYFLNEVW
jgi:hypothetical protein